MTDQTYQFQPYDVIQIERTSSNVSGMWVDFSTIRTPLDASQAEGLVNSGMWEGKAQNFRIVRYVPGKGPQPIYVRPAPVVEVLTWGESTTSLLAAKPVNPIGEDLHPERGEWKPMKRVTWKVAKAIITNYGFTITKRDNEYRLATRVGMPAAEASAYYTTDLADALDTAREWAKALTQTTTAVRAADGSSLIVVTTIVNAEIHISIHDADNRTTHLAKFVRMAKRHYADDDTGDTGGR